MADWTKAPWAQDLLQTLSQRLPTVIGALGILVGGWLVALFARKLVHAGLSRTTIDDKVAKLVGFDTGGDAGDRIERAIAKTVYYVVITFVLVAFFSYLKIDAVTQPLVAVLSELGTAVPNIIKAVALGVGGYLLAKGVRRVLLMLLERSGFERRFVTLTSDAAPAAAAEAEPAPEEGTKKKKKDDKKKPVEQPMTALIADVAYWFILVVVAIPVLEALKISVLAAPMSAALGTITTYLPKIGGAVLLMIAGYVVSRIVRAIVSGVLERVGVDRVLTKIGLGALSKETPLSRVLGTIAMTFVLLQFAISAVGRLELEEISVPLRTMLERIYAYLPKLLVGGVLLAVGVVIGRIAGNVAARLLAAVGFNTLVSHVGLYQADERSVAQETEAKKLVEDRMRRMEEGAEGPPSGARPDELLASHGTRGIKTPADVGGVVVGTLVVLLFLRQVLSTLELTGLEHLLDELLSFVPHVLVSTIVLGAGLWAGRWVHQRVDELTATSADKRLKVLGTVGHVAVVAFAAMVALQQLGVGSQMIAIAFGLVLGAVCLAAALAFGLGGRDVASKILHKEYERRGGAKPPEG
ncbi:MAG TPA: mechanosensitive ion channel [Polyangiaceae bacterium]|jgi:hypothetical protein|nr:mechanosensitive ion channel [Polyangiaceae bacterium]